MAFENVFFLNAVLFIVKKVKNLETFVRRRGQSQLQKNKKNITPDGILEEKCK